MSPFTEKFVAGFAGIVTAALLHFMWQGTVLSLGLVAVVKLLAVDCVQRRYLISVGTLVLMIMAPLVTICFSLPCGSWSQRTADLAIDRANNVVDRRSVVEGQSITANTHRVEQASAVISDPRWTDGVELCILFVWLSGVVIFSTRTAFGFGVTLWIKSNVRPLSEQYQERLRALGEKLNVDVRNRVFSSMRVGQAVAVGFIRPIVLIPASWLTQLTPEMLEAVVAHELAHIRRWDLWVNLVQRVIETFLFFHPAVWWLTSRIRLEREMCCDEIAAGCLNRAAYARSLESVARIATGNLLMAASIKGFGKMNLSLRIRNILGVTTGDTGSRWGITAVGAIFLSLVAVLAFSLATGSSISEAGASSEAAESMAIGKMELLGGKIIREGGLPNGPVTAIDLRGSARFNDRYAHLLSTFGELKSLNLEGTRITAECFKDLVKIRGLKQLQLHGTAINDEQLMQLKSSLPNVTVMIEDDEETAAIPKVESLGGQVTRDNDLLGQPVIEISFELKNNKNEMLRDEDLTLLTKFSMLKSLNLNYTLVTDEGVKVVALSKNLTTLRLDGTSISDEAFKDINGLTNLTSLSLFATKVTGTGFKELSPLKNLSNLNLRRTKVTDENLEGLRHLTGLTTLSLEETSISDAGMEVLTQLTQLTSLNVQKSLNDKERITDEGLKNLRNLCNLTSLNLYCNQITNEGLKEVGQLPNLKSLYIYGSAITDAGLKELLNLKQLETLDANHISITPDGLKTIGEMASLTFIDLCDSKVTDEGLAHLVGLKRLNRLFLAGSKVTDVGLRKLAAFDELTILVVGSPNITDAGMKEIGKLQNVKAINLGDTAITDSGLSQLRQLEHLKHLHLYNTKITDRGLKEIAAFKNLNLLSIDGTDVTEMGAESLKIMRPDLEVRR